MEEWQEKMSSKEFAIWMAFDKMSPGEPERGDFQAALIAYTVASAHKSKKTRAFKLEDFLLRFGPKHIIRKSAREIKMKLLAFKAMFDQREKEKGKEK